MNDAERGFNTRAIHPDGERTPGPVSPPIVQSSTFALGSTEHGRHLARETAPVEFYSRWGNPTVREFEDAVARLEGAECALATASGIAAVTSAIVSHLEAGDHVIASRALYGEVPVLLGQILPRFGVTATLVDPTEPGALKSALTPRTRILYVESPSNPVLQLVDLEATGQFARDHGIRALIDSTFATPFNQTPLRHGFHAVIHSATKYLGGHSDLTAGVIAGDRAFVERVWNHYRVFGPVLSPHDAWLAHRGIKTLGIRMERHNANALAIAQFLESHPAIERVYYPGLESHPQHELAKRQMTGFGGVLSFELHDGFERARRFADSLKLVILAVSLGGVDSLLSHPASMTHSFVPRDQRIAAGVTDGLIRMSVGCEDAADIIADLAQALSH